MSKKLVKNIRKAIEKIIGGGSYVDYEYDYSQPDFCVWSAIQPETSDILTGTYDFQQQRNRRISFVHGTYEHDT